MLEWLISLWSDPNTRWILLGCTLLGLGSGVIGSFTFLRRESLLGDTLAHAALPGVCIAFMLTEVKSAGLFLAGALLAGVAAVLCVSAISRHTRIKPDAAMGIVLTFFFGVGTVMLTHIQHSGSGSQSGLDKYLFGQAAAMVTGDVYVLMGVSLLLIVLALLLFKEFKLISFDPGFARGIGLPVGLLEHVLLILTTVAVAAGIQAVGVVLVAALLITPAAAARYWTDRLPVMLAAAGVFGALSGTAGAAISTLGEGIPTGPVTVLAATLLFAVSLLLAPGRGLAARALRHRGMRAAYARTVDGGAPPTGAAEGRES
ncbi:iron chelate uptake ABC transporter family permease subunit [Saccharibacillus sp. CPCC 101409]|uniref:metal ABC transporter permease n=1 Tax=Saccharibacillus sp. CPCC 101409 TaxID=3058041 RepID=UPI0026717BE9|nr:iron chelate uptake ABC transporter family permease subunit [Saccharibacillus sp. CPCC 101409]MDO3411009.1 iron chelate uptake ABC transporter family permease subunit [Saccharibacillus sp. CPCC 101409]